MVNCTANELLREASRLFDAPQSDLQTSARKAWQGGFDSAGEWMREALWLLRGGSLPYRTINFSALGWMKYGTAGSAAVIVWAVALHLKQIWLMPVALLLFYIIEAQMVFLFPLAMDGSA